MKGEAYVLGVINLLLFVYVNLVVLIDSSDSLHILRKNMVKVKKAPIRSKGNMPPCRGMCWGNESE